MVNNLPAMQETKARCLGGEDPLEEVKAAHPSIPAWRIPRTEEPGGLQSTGRARLTCLSSSSGGEQCVTCSYACQCPDQENQETCSPLLPNTSSASNSLLGI